MPSALIGEGGHPLPFIPTGNPTPDWIIQHRIRESLASGLPDVRQEPEHDRRMVLACAGPSLADSWEGRSDGDVWCVGGVHDWLLDRGTIPYAWAACDPLPSIAQYAQRPQEGVRYYLASMCDPLLFQALEGFDVRIWHSEVRAGTREVLEASGRPWTLVGGGSSIGTRALFLGYVLGYRTFEVHGMDGSSRDGRTHASKSASVYHPPISLQVNGREFMVPTNMAAQVQDVEKILATHKLNIDFRGDGIIQELARSV